MRASTDPLRAEVATVEGSSGGMVKMIVREDEIEDLLKLALRSADEIHDATTARPAKENSWPTPPTNSTSPEGISLRP
jgi:hypothetical protein